MSSTEIPTLELTAAPGRLVPWIRSLWQYRSLGRVLAAKDFKVRYKRALFGVIWAVLMPAVQAAVIVVVFGRLGLDAGQTDYIGYVLAGVMAWSYISLTVLSGTTAVVDGSGLTDKVWFPRALLVLAPVLSNLIGLGIGLGIVLAVQAVRGELLLRSLVLVPAVLLLTALVAGSSLLLSALYVWFRDVRFITQAVLLLGFYVTPVVYTAERLGPLQDWLILNPFAGVVGLFQNAVVGAPLRTDELASSVGVAVALLMIGAVVHARNDRVMVDLL